ncbi:uncharacterized protein LOC127037472 [Gopherus flavomarginatus]|uniref:uncharacterized protein LOC127037472 n=1 Tax=Gopherus flavomarginatus TaxID=286002 RepID=UPI0021CBC230|nr:uncharacterized protein LOC127037472 [Gopherus flavomarginatus]XP_050785190.1 uncharacterized protein LOC127037472 [Gopherus flavomarginatus]
MGEPRAHRPVSPEPLGNGEVMAYHHLLEKDIVILCTKRGLRMGTFTKAQLIVQLEEKHRSEEQIPGPDGATRGSESSWSMSQASPGVWSPIRRGSSRLGSPSGDWRRMGWEQSPREREDHERKQQPEEKLQEKQQQRGLVMVDQRDIGGCPGVSGETRLQGRDPGTERTVVVQPQMLRDCGTWVKFPGVKPLALPMAQIPVQTQEGLG